MKKILMVCEAFGGGVFSYVTQLCNDMVDYFDVYLAYSFRPQTPKDFRKFLDERIHLIEVKKFSGLGNPIKMLACIKELRKIEREINPDIIHLHSSIAGGIGRLAFKGKQNKVIYTPHGYAHILMGKGMKSKLYYLAEKVLGKKNCLTLTCCKSEDEVAKTLCKKTYFIETGINIKELSSSLESINPVEHNSFTVYTLGRACTQKQPWLFNEIALRVPEASFIWIGGGELEKELTAPNITITGWKSRSEALAIAKGADAFVLCSLGEAIAMSLLENMYLKKVCLVSNVMGNKSVIVNGENGFICDNSEQFAERIKEAMVKYPQNLVEKAYSDILAIYNTEEMKIKYAHFYNGL